MFISLHYNAFRFKAGVFFGSFILFFVFRILAKLGPVVKAENFAGTTKPSSLFLLSSYRNVTYTSLILVRNIQLFSLTIYTNGVFIVVISVLKSKGSYSQLIHVMDNNIIQSND